MNNIKSIVPPKVVDMSQSPILSRDVLSEGNLGNMTLTMFIDISKKPSILEHIQLNKPYRLEEIKAYTN